MALGRHLDALDRPPEASFRRLFGLQDALSTGAATRPCAVVAQAANHSFEACHGPFGNRPFVTSTIGRYTKADGRWSGLARE